MKSYLHKIRALIENPTQALIDEFVKENHGYYRGFGYHIETPKGGVFVDLDPRAERTTPTVHLSWLSAFEKGSGAGDYAMKKLTELADKYKVKLELTAGVGKSRKGGSPISRLKRFYGRHGFVVRYGDTMIRQPK